MVTTDALVVGKSRRMREIFEFLRLIGPSETTVLITGESGTGKEVTATLIHQNSRRQHRPFIAVSCALFTETLIESELFGHERGAFTGAVKDRPGRFEMAEGGTIFLDDIDDIPLPMQVKLLRVLQNRTVERVGGIRTIPINVRVVAGTKRDLRQMVADGRFREDLYYRLNVLPVSLPPLRERPEDIPVLMQHFLKRFFDRKGEAVPPISEPVMQAFVRYNWPGNVRELENACERIAQVCTCGHVRIGCVSASILFAAAGQPPRAVDVVSAIEQAMPADQIVEQLQVSRESEGPVVAPAPPPPDLKAAELTPTPISLDDRMRDYESSLIGWALRTTHGNKSRAAALLQIKRSTLSDRIGRCGRDRPSAEPEAATV